MREFPGKNAISIWDTRFFICIVMVPRRTFWNNKLGVGVRIGDDIRLSWIRYADLIVIWLLLCF
jgi:hypothetical protein